MRVAALFPPVGRGNSPREYLFLWRAHRGSQNPACGGALKFARAVTELSFGRQVQDL
jgi:hypothetical protein